MEKNYVMYHCHSDYSLLDSCTKYEEYIELAKKCGMRGISFSEHGKPINWCEKWDKSKKAGLKYMHSVEIYLTRNLDEKIRDNYHTILIAKNKEGISELNRLVKLSTDERHFFYKNRLSFEEFLNISDNIITTSACLGSPLRDIDEKSPMFYAMVSRYDFLEIQPHDCDDQKEFNKFLYRISKLYDKPLIAATDTHSSTKYKAECREVILGAKMNKSGKDGTDKESEFDLTFKTYDELVEMFRVQDSLPEDVYLEAIENTNKLLDMCDDIELDTSIKYPILYGSREEDEEFFIKTVLERFNEKIDSGVIPISQKEAFIESIEEELRVFKKLDMCGFMLSMSELITWCKNNDIAIGTARGSVGGSRVAYVTDIIDLNPETWKTVFSRFCNEDRVEVGD